MTVPYPDLTGALLAGGRALRLGGAAKGLLTVEGEPIAARSLRLFGALCGGALVVSGDAATYGGLGAPVVPDLLPGKGAPGGLHAALSAAGTPWVFVTGCDMPFLSARGISLLADRRAGAGVVVPRWRGHLEPLHGLWARAGLPVIEAALRAGDPSLVELMRLVGLRVLEEAEWRTVDPEGRAFENANTPADVARLGLSR